MMTEIYSIEGGQKDVSSLEEDQIKKKLLNNMCCKDGLLNSVNQSFNTSLSTPYT